MLTTTDGGCCAGKRARWCSWRHRKISRQGSSLRKSRARPPDDTMVGRGPRKVSVRSEQHLSYSVSFANSTVTNLDGDGKENVASPDPSRDVFHVVSAKITSSHMKQHQDVKRPP